MKRKFRKITLLLSGILAIGAVDQVHAAITAYDQIFPYYMESCSVSQLLPKTGNPGGKAGHGLAYLKGVCRDRDAQYPRIRLCRDGEVDLTDENSGTAVSVDSMFKNIQWMAIEGRDQMFYAGLDSHARITTDVVQEIARKAAADGVVKGAKVHDHVLAKWDNLQETKEQFIARQAIGTDYGISLARTAYCARIPVTRDQMQTMVEYYNHLNEQYFDGNTEYNWSGIYNNCTHVIHNALAAIGLLKPMKIERSLPVQIFNIALPSDEFIRDARIANQEASPNVAGMYYRRGRVFPVGGGITRIQPMMAENNDVYDASLSMATFSFPVLRPKAREFKRLSTERRYTDLVANYQYHLGKTEEALSKLPSLKTVFSLQPELLQDEKFIPFYASYVSDLDRLAQTLREGLHRAQALSAN